MASTHQSLQRAVAILREFSEAEPALTVSEISARLDLHKSTVSRLLGALRDEGLVWHNPATGRYSLGMGLVEMAGVALGQIDVRAAALPHMERLAEETTETVSVAVRRGRDAVTVAYVPSRHPLRHVVWIGRRLPLAKTAAGTTLLAAMHAAGDDWRALAAIESQDNPAEWERDFVTTLERVLRAGYADESDQYEPGIAAMAAPVFDPSGNTTAALTVSGPSARFDAPVRAATGPLLIQTADAIAADLGVRGAVEVGA